MYRWTIRLTAAIALLLSLMPALAGTGIGAERHPAPGRYVWVDDKRLHIHCLGEGSPTVIFDSGLGGYSLDWTRVHGTVAGFTRACVYDRAGYGWSDRAISPRHSANIVADLERLLGSGDIAGPYVLVGHSFGGLNVRLYASRNPRLVAGLVLVDSSHEAQFERFEQAGLARLVPQGRQFRLRNSDQIPDALPESLRPLAQDFASSANGVGTLYSELAHLQLSAHQVGAASPLPDVPLIVICRSTVGLNSASGSASGEFGQIWLGLQRELAKRTSHSSLIIARTRDHYIQLKEPELVIKAIRDVVDAAVHPDKS